MELLNGLIDIAVRWQAGFKRRAMADMHRMACGYAGRALPLAPAGQARSPLTFPPRERRLLGWHRFICRGSH